MGKAEGRKVKVTMITEQKVLEVSPGYLQGSPARVLVDVCVACGAVVFDPFLHDRWHRSMSQGSGSLAVPRGSAEEES